MGVNPVGNAVNTFTDPTGRTIIDAGAGNDKIFIGKAPGELGKQGMYVVDINGAQQYLTEAQLRNTTFRGGKGDDAIRVSDQVKVPITMEGGDGDDLLVGGSGDDTIRGGAGADTIFGGDGRNTLDGGRGDDLIWGGNDGDVITGGSGNDEIFGGKGDDIILGQAGNDYIEGEEGRDTISGGAGRNTAREGPDGVVDVVLNEGGKLKVIPADAPYTNKGP